MCTEKHNLFEWWYKNVYLSSYTSVYSHSNLRNTDITIFQNNIIGSAIMCQLDKVLLGFKISYEINFDLSIVTCCHITINQHSVSIPKGDRKEHSILEECSIFLQNLSYLLFWQLTVICFFATWITHNVLFLISESHSFLSFFIMFFSLLSSSCRILSFTQELFLICWILIFFFYQQLWFQF